jgi:RND family efflux transporter MFP subunit
VALARYELERATALAPKQLISEQVVKQREAELNALLAEQEAQAVAIRIAEANLAKTVLRAPFKALVIDRPGQVGALATPGTPLLEIVDLTQLEVSARIQAQVAGSINAATRFELEANGTRYTLRLRALVAMVDPRTRTREARLTFSGAGALPGSAGELVWRNPQIHVPADLVVRRDASLGVFTVVKGKAEFVALPGAEEGRPAPTTLAPDTLLVTEGRFRLKPGDAVEVGK